MLGLRRCESASDNVGCMRVRVVVSGRGDERQPAALPDIAAMWRWHAPGGLWTTKRDPTRPCGARRGCRARLSAGRRRCCWRRAWHRRRRHRGAPLRWPVGAPGPMRLASLVVCFMRCRPLYGMPGLVCGLCQHSSRRWAGLSFVVLSLVQYLSVASNYTHHLSNRCNAIK